MSKPDMSTYASGSNTGYSYSSTAYGTVHSAGDRDLERYPLTAIQHPMGPDVAMDDNDDDQYRFNKQDLDRVQRRLKQRHVQMIAIGKRSLPSAPGL